jgi:hypothetical protein
MRICYTMMSFYKSKRGGLQLQTVSKMRIICYILMSFYKSKRGGLQWHPYSPSERIHRCIEILLYPCNVSTPRNTTINYLDWQICVFCCCQTLVFSFDKKYALFICEESSLVSRKLKQTKAGQCTVKARRINLQLFPNEHMHDQMSKHVRKLARVSYIANARKTRACIWYIKSCLCVPSTFTLLWVLKAILKREHEACKCLACMFSVTLIFFLA